MSRRTIALSFIPLIALLLVVSQTGLAADDRIFYGLIALFLLSQLAWFFHLYRQSRREEYERLISRNFPDD